MSQFVVSARKYRPQKFSEVIGQEHVTTTLVKSISGNKLAHAFLFCGPRGVGKTTCARILAKAVNCTDRKMDAEPCGECSSCKSFNETNITFNIIELDAASHNSVEEMRALNEQVRFPPQQGKYKVFIIDEVHMLSTNAFNAFLKTLEEPPPYAIFILATTEKHKILPTILSRCQSFDFKRISVSEIVRHLKEIATIESHVCEEEALHLIAQKSDGGLRDALSIYDRLISYADGNLTYENVIKNLNILDYDYYFKVLDSILCEDRNEVLLLLDEIIQLGHDPLTFLVGLSEHIRNIWVCKDVATTKLLEVSDSVKIRYSEQAKTSSPFFLLNALDILNHTGINYQKAQNKKLHVEMALLKLSTLRRPEIQMPIVKKKDPVDSVANIVFDVDHKKEKIDPSSIIVEEKIDSNPIVKEEEVVVAPSSVEKSGTDHKINTIGVEGEENNLTKENPISVMSTPSLGSLTQMDEEIKNKEQEWQNEALEFNLDALNKLIQEYSANANSISVQQALKDAKIELEDLVINVMTFSTLGKTTFEQEVKLLDHIREHFKNQKINWTINLDEVKAAEIKKAFEKRLPLTNKEKYDKLVSKNPYIEELRKKFSLKVDHS